MVLNMDTELQRLICVSVEKMTRDVNGRGLPASASRKSRGLDLRKALLVAHVLQDMRSAYISDDYKMLVNTVCPDLNISSEIEMEKLRRTLLRKEYHDGYSEEVRCSSKRFISNDWTNGTVDRPPRSESDETAFMTTQYRCPAGSQDCVFTCSDATMSKISQITHPIPVSINTSYVLSHQTSKKDSNDAVEDSMECDDAPAVCEQVEVTSSNDLDSEPVETEIVHCEELDNVESSPEFITKSFDENFGEKTTVTKQSETLKTQGSTASSISCPLPRKKRPLPKEFLDPEAQSVSNKRTKVDDVVTSSASDAVVTTSGCHLSTTTATTLTQSTALSTSQMLPASQCPTSQTSPCSTVTSSMCTTVVSSSGVTTTSSGPKVVVEMNKGPSFNNLWSWTLPATCTQPRLSRWLLDSVYRSQLTDITNLRESSIHNTGMPGLVAY